MTPNAHIKMTELQVPLSQPWEESNRGRSCVALEVAAKRIPRYMLPDHFSFSRGDSQEGILDCDSRVPPLILSETEDNLVRYSYRVLWNVSLLPFSKCRSDDIRRNLPLHG
jgi:hypothetical protein